MIASACPSRPMGWPEEAPFDAILLTAAPRSVPSALFSQLGPEGVLVAPVGLPGEVQDLLRFRSERGGELTRELLGHCRFVPFTVG
jgi:protein-L-isoaspartate(D-aspartate) O-methyltransferase